MDSFDKLSSRIIAYENAQKRKLSKSIALGGFPMLIFLGLGLWFVYLGGYAIGSIFIALICLMFWVYVRNISLYRTRVRLHKLITKNIQTIESIDTILYQSQILANQLEKALRQKILFSQAKLRVNYFDNLIGYSLYVLMDLRSDLQIRLAEQQKSLKSAKSEVSTHIKGTSELQNISELQSTRLDRQIEQFEELQRVLVKI